MLLKFVLINFCNLVIYKNYNVKANEKIIGQWLLMKHIATAALIMSSL